MRVAMITLSFTVESFAKATMTHVAFVSGGFCGSYCAFGNSACILVTNARRASACEICIARVKKLIYELSSQRGTRAWLKFGISPFSSSLHMKHTMAKASIASSFMLASFLSYLLNVPPIV